MKNLKKMKHILTAIVCITLFVSCGKSKEEKVPVKAKKTTVIKTKKAPKKGVFVVNKKPSTYKKWKVLVSLSFSNLFYKNLIDS